MKKYFIIGSLNPLKESAARLALIRSAVDAHVIRKADKVTSGVAKQPFTVAEGVRGAKYRAEMALESVAHQKISDQVYGIGIESYLYALDESWYEGLCVCVTDGHRSELAFGSSARVTNDLVHELQGNPLIDIGNIVDRITGTVKSKESGGYIAWLTCNSVSRFRQVEETILLAVSQFFQLV